MRSAELWTLGWLFPSAELPRAFQEAHVARAAPPLELTWNDQQQLNYQIIWPVAQIASLQPVLKDDGTAKRILGHWDSSLALDSVPDVCTYQVISEGRLPHGQQCDDSCLLRHINTQCYKVALCSYVQSHLIMLGGDFPSGHVDDTTSRIVAHLSAMSETTPSNADGYKIHDATAPAPGNASTSIHSRQTTPDGSSTFLAAMLRGEKCVNSDDLCAMAPEKLQHIASFLSSSAEALEPQSLMRFMLLQTKNGTMDLDALWKDIETDKAIADNWKPAAAGIMAKEIENTQLLASTATDLDPDTDGMKYTEYWNSAGRLNHPNLLEDAKWTATMDPGIKAMGYRIYISQQDGTPLARQPRPGMLQSTASGEWAGFKASSNSTKVKRTTQGSDLTKPHARSASHKISGGQRSSTADHARRAAGSVWPRTLPGGSAPRVRHYEASVQRMLNQPIDGPAGTAPGYGFDRTGWKDWHTGDKAKTDGSRMLQARRNFGSSVPAKGSVGSAVDSLGNPVIRALDVEGAASGAVSEPIMLDTVMTRVKGSTQLQIHNVNPPDLPKEPAVDHPPEMPQSPEQPGIPEEPPIPPPKDEPVHDPAGPPSDQPHPQPKEPVQDPADPPSDQPHPQPKEPVQDPADPPSDQPHPQPKEPVQDPAAHPENHPNPQPQDEPSKDPAGPPDDHPNPKPQDEPVQDPAGHPDDNPNPQPQPTEPVQDPAGHPDDNPNPQPQPKEPVQDPAGQPDDLPKPQPEDDPISDPAGHPDDPPIPQPKDDPIPDKGTDGKPLTDAEKDAIREQRRKNRKAKEERRKARLAEEKRAREQEAREKAAREKAAREKAAREKWEREHAGKPPGDIPDGNNPKPQPKPPVVEFNDDAPPADDLTKLAKIEPKEILAPKVENPPTGGGPVPPKAFAVEDLEAIAKPAAQGIKAEDAAQVAVKSGVITATEAAALLGQRAVAVAAVLGEWLGAVSIGVDLGLFVYAAVEFMKPEPHCPRPSIFTDPWDESDKTVLTLNPPCASPGDDNYQGGHQARAVTMTTVTLRTAGPAVLPAQRRDAIPMTAAVMEAGAVMHHHPRPMGSAPLWNPTLRIPGMPITAASTCISKTFSEGYTTFLVPGFPCPITTPLECTDENGRFMAMKLRLREQEHSMVKPRYCVNGDLTGHRQAEKDGCVPNFDSQECIDKWLDVPKGTKAREGGVRDPEASQVASQNVNTAVRLT